MVFELWRMNTLSFGRASLTTSSAVIIFVRLAMGSGVSGWRRHSTWPVFTSNRRPARGATLKLTSTVGPPISDIPGGPSRRARFDDPGTGWSFGGWSTSALFLLMSPVPTNSQTATPIIRASATSAMPRPRRRGPPGPRGGRRSLGPPRRLRRIWPP
jgi:hypothetical protein